MSSNKETTEKEKKEKLEKLDRRLYLVLEWTFKLIAVFLAICFVLQAINTMYIKHGDYERANFVETIMISTSEAWLLILIGMLSYASCLEYKIIKITQMHRWDDIQYFILSLLMLGIGIVAFLVLI
ncbi:MAG: hypothetical protein JHC26_05640 [Thermofilum sp.]|jgi:uncharacterized membrane protein YidH (DUF202 family)|uniref:hypothetical protein n=1 Tax=Thermofilum sp. TaxID=1961369 RepID=UPI00258E4865|nr:hypothetical protein [Thermofilum sp.]MCI4408554.1 hypothetical protein [Thermofilum sp.]